MRLVCGKQEDVTLFMGTRHAMKRSEGGFWHVARDRKRRKKDSKEITLVFVRAHMGSHLSDRLVKVHIIARIRQ